MYWILSHSGPPVPKRIRRAGAEVVAIPGLYSVSYVIAGEGAVAVVDVGSRTDVPGIVDGLADSGFDKSDVQAVVASHLHFDHVLGLDALAVQLDAPVALGNVAYEHVTEGRPLASPSLFSLMRAWPTWIMQGMPAVPSADLLATADLGAPWGSFVFRSPKTAPLVHGKDLPGLPGWKVLESPGHTDDSICLHHPEAGFLVAGDTVRNYVGGEWNPLLASPKDFAATKKLIESLHVETIFPGHGPILEGEAVVRNLKTLPPWFP